jgi:hypothetical protein
MATFIMDFPPDPVIGQTYTNAYNAVYRWNGTAWIVELVDTPGFDIIGDLIKQIRVLLQDLDPAGGGYRYSDVELITNVNQGLVEMYRMRPDIFLALGFKIPFYNNIDLTKAITIEPQFVPSLIYYAVGMAQLRDDEATQDQRAGSFLSKFTSMLAAVA